MKVLLEQKDLAKLVPIVARAAATNSVIPIQAGMMLEAGGGKLTATSLDLAIGIRMSTAEVQVEKEGRVLVNAHHLNDLVKKLPEGVITLEEQDNKLNIKYGRSRAGINTLQVTDWAGWPDKGYTEKFSLPQDKLKLALQSTVLAVAKSHFRQVFTGVLIDVQPSENEVRFVGTDTHRLAYYRYAAENMPGESWEPIVPAPAVTELIRFLRGDDNCSVGLNGNNIVFCWENFEMFSRLIEGQFPNYHQVIPQNIIGSIDITTEGIRQSVERINALPITGKNMISCLSLSIKDNIYLRGNSDNIGEINETCEFAEKAGEDIDISLNTAYLLDALKVMPETAKLSFSGPQSPAIMQGSPEYLIVLMPLRVA